MAIYPTKLLMLSETLILVTLSKLKSPIQDLGSFRLPTNFRERSDGYVQLWWLVQSTLFGMSPQFLYGWRRFLLRLFGASIGTAVLIRPSVRITFPWKVCIGNNSWIGDDVVLYSLGAITIGSNAVISQKSYLCTGSHDIGSPHFDIQAQTITVQDEAWVATDVFIAPGVTIGQGAVVGARSSVFKDIPPLVVAVGNPAVVVRARGVSQEQRSCIS